jgi:hypothetical protein
MQVEPVRTALFGRDSISSGLSPQVQPAQFAPRKQKMIIFAKYFLKHFENEENKKIQLY